MVGTFLHSPYVGDGVPALFPYLFMAYVGRSKVRDEATPSMVHEMGR